jgi:glycerol-3-phosphate acyltransferase PlsY
VLHPTDWSLALPSYAAALAFGYLLGSIPFGLILTRLAGTQDIRSIGSGNIGATNVLRTGRKGLAAATLILDALKGTVAVLAAYWYGGQESGQALAILAGLGAFLGHLFPVWLRFRGGKGVATYIGLLIAFAWQAALAFGIVWAVIAAVTRYSSLAGLLASAAAVAVLWFTGHVPEAELFGLLTLLVWAKHHQNISRLIAGTESKIGR